MDKMNDDRKHLTPREVEKLLDAARQSRNPERDRCLFLVMFRHGLRGCNRVFVGTTGLSELAADHVLPFSKGGLTVWSNMILRCKLCNIKKFNSIL